MNEQIRKLLKEAQRRYMGYRRDDPLIDAWTGLGYRTTYKPVLEAGLMEWVFECPLPRTMEWLRLTEAGAEIVQRWLDGAETKRESFTVVTISREDVNYAMGLPPDHKFGMGFSDDQMVTIAKRLGEAYIELGVWAILRDIVDTTLRGDL